MVEGDLLWKHALIRTPGVDRLALPDMRLSNGYVPTPTCIGLTVSIQYGMTSARAQCRSVFDVLTKKQRRWGWTDETSLAQLLRALNQNDITAIYFPHFPRKVDNDAP